MSTHNIPFQYKKENHPRLSQWDNGIGIFNVYGIFIFIHTFPSSMYFYGSNPGPFNWRKAILDPVTHI